jgi:uncharacterized protein (TIGR02594 family)
MSITRIMTDIPPAQVSFVIAAIRADGGTFERIDQPDGNLTIIATFPGPDRQPELPVGGSPAARWMGVARGELGVSDATTQGGAEPDSVPWCSSFVNFCVERAGLQGTKSKMARSWVDWGVDAADFVPGCIVVAQRGSPPSGHVGFYVGRENGRVRLLGGNQGDKVTIASFDGAKVIARRLPA